MYMYMCVCIVCVYIYIYDVYTCMQMRYLLFLSSHELMQRTVTSEEADCTVLCTCRVMTKAMVLILTTQKAITKHMPQNAANPKPHHGHENDHPYGGDDA